MLPDHRAACRNVNKPKAGGLTFYTLKTCDLANSCYTCKRSTAQYLKGKKVYPNGYFSLLLFHFGIIFPFFLSHQLPKNARIMSFSVPVASVYPPPSSATWTMTVQMARTRLPVPNPPAAVGPSSATTRCVFQPSGAAMATTTAPTGPTSGRRIAMDIRTSRPLAAAATSSSVQMGSASTAAGGAMEAWTVWIARTKSTAVSYLSFCFIPLPFLFLFFFLQTSFLC